MKYVIVPLVLILAFSCKSAKKYTKYNTMSSIESVEVLDSTAGISDTEIKIDLSEVEVEITKYEPVYFKQNGKDTVVLKPVIYRKINTIKTEEQTISIDTTSVKDNNSIESKQTDNTETKSQFKGYNIVKDIVSSVVQGFLTPFLKYAWVLGLLLAAPIISRIKKKISGNEPKL